MESEDNELIIVNRKCEYTVSKKLICSSVPYFEKMFCCDLLESKENKVVLDFDEKVFDSILDWIHSGSFVIQMENVISFYDAADYLMINEPLFQPCLAFFHENFTIEHLPVVLPQVTKVSKLISSAAIDNIICRHFLMIANTNVFLDYSVETVETILKLDLMVHSEYQIFESIIKWVNKKVDSRKTFLHQLLSCVHWSFMDLDDLSKVKDNELIKIMPNLDSITTSNGDCEFNRSAQSFFISIQEIDVNVLRIKMYDNEFFCLSIGDFTRDDTMPLEYFSGEHTSDILFDSGTKGIRIDWVKKTFRWLDFKVSGKTYYSQINEMIYKFAWFTRKNSCYLEDIDSELPQSIPTEEILILESIGKFNLIGKTRDDKKWFGLFTFTNEGVINRYSDRQHSFKATVLEPVVYILTKDREFIQFNYETKNFNKSEPFKDEKWDFNDLILTSHQSKDDKVILVNKSSGKVYVFNIKEQKWLQKYRIVNISSKSSNDMLFHKLITFTSAFLPMKVIKPLYKRTFSAL
ncbi:kelch-like protein 6 [Tetranychus urticae]|uniref:kelch-like protein 6 n=1 Tax=Tetranychus urticae TaxID=32264 RepID=UPI00077BF36F|nr:kelch-like protein 6 [Tetranychus urticae]